MVKVLLIEPHQDILGKDRQKRIDSPLNLIYLATYIRDKHEVEIYDRNINANDKDFLSFLEDYNPDIVGFTSMTSLMLHDLIHLGKIIKELRTNIIIIVGGTHATIEPDSLLDEPYVDYIIRGEGEETLLEFCDTFEKDKKKLRDLKNINNNPLRPLMDINNLKIPDYSLIDIKKYDHFYVILSRGCIGNCTFCSNHKMWGKNGNSFVRMFSVEKSIETLKNLIDKYKINNFSLMDDNFLNYKERVRKICNYLEGKRLNFFCFGRADCINDEILSYLKKAGCHTIQIGIESGSQRVLDFLNKNTTVEQNEEAIKCVERNGITCDASVMTGIASETKEELTKTLEFIKRVKPSCPDAQIFNPMPGTPIFDYCVERKLIKKPETLLEWANWTGDWTLESGMDNNVSEIPEEYILKVAKEIRDYRVLINKLKRFLFWVKKGETKQAIKSSFFFIRRKIGN